MDDFCGELVIDTDNNVIINYDDVMMSGEYFNAMLCGETKREVIDKLLIVISRIAFTHKDESSSYVDDIYNKLMALKKEALKGDFTYFNMGGNMCVDFGFRGPDRYSVVL